MNILHHKVIALTIGYIFIVLLMVFVFGRAAKRSNNCAKPKCDCGDHHIRGKN